METVSTSYQRLFVRCVKIDAAARGMKLDAVLNEAATAQVKATAGGVTLVSSSGNGHSFNILPNGGEGLTPLSYAELISDTIDRLEAAKAALIGAGIPTPTDDELYAEVLSKLQPVTSVRPDFSGWVR